MSVKFPEVTASIRADGVTAGLTAERLLFVGQMLSGGNATTGILQENILSDKAEDTLFGSASPLAAAIRRGRRRNGETQFDAIGIDDNGAGVAASGALVVTGTATESGSLIFYVGSKKFNKYTIAVADTDTAASVGDAIVTALLADANSLVTGINTAGSVAITAKTKGTFGNTIGLKSSGDVAGLSVSLTAMASGATDPVLTGVFDAIGNQRYQGIVWQFDENTEELTEFLEARFNVSNDVLDGIGFVGKTDTHANHLSTLGALNFKTLSYNVDKLINDTDHIGAAVLDLPFTKVAEFAAIRALKRTDESVLGDLVISRSPLDSFGGPHQNSKPYANTPFPDLLVPDVGDSFTDVEIGQLKESGGWVIDANRAYINVIAGEVVTTYKTDVAGNPDPTFGFLNYIDTSTTAREYIVNNTRSQYPQYRASGGALVPKVDMANEASIAAFVAEKYNELGDLGLVNIGAGTINGEDVDYDKEFRDNLTVSLNPVTGRFSVACKLFIVVQLRAVIYDLAIAFEI